MAKGKKVKAVKAEPKKLKKVAKAKAVKVVKSKAAKAAKPVKAKKLKLKTYKVAGKFSVDSEGNVVKPSKSISLVKKVDEYLNQKGKTVKAVVATFVIEV